MNPSKTKIFVGSKKARGTLQCYSVFFYCVGSRQRFSPPSWIIFHNHCERNILQLQCLIDLSKPPLMRPWWPNLRRRKQGTMWIHSWMPFLNPPPMTPIQRLRTELQRHLEQEEAKWGVVGEEMSSQSSRGGHTPASV